MRDLKDGIRSHVRIDFKGQVHKVFRGTDADKRCANEIKILQALEERGCPYVPQLIEHDLDSLTIVTTNCGQPVPNLSKEKADTLFSELEHTYGIRHDDPEPRNVTYNPWMGRFCIIDFELSELLPLPSTEEAEAEAFTCSLRRMQWAACSDSGTGGDANDDAWIGVELTSGRGRRLDDHGELFIDAHPVLLAVADGIGGGRAGELASRLLLAGMRRKLAKLCSETSSEDWPEVLNKLVHQSHEELNTFGDREENLSRMGCTLTMGLFHGNTLVLAHVGDSRLYRCRDGKTELLSMDHTFAFASWKRGELSEYKFREHPRRSALYDAMGCGHDSLNPVIESFETQPGDRYLLCSDGVVDGLWEEHFASILPEINSADEARDELLTRAREGCDFDDATLIVADFLPRNG